MIDTNTKVTLEMSIEDLLDLLETKYLKQLDGKTTKNEPSPEKTSENKICSSDDAIRFLTNEFKLLDEHIETSYEYLSMQTYKMKTYKGFLSDGTIVMLKTIKEEC